MTRLWSVLTVVVVGLSCGGGPEGPGALTVSLGTGGPGRFEPPRDGVLLLQRGCQGAQHIFTSVRVEGAASAETLEVRVAIHRVGDGTLVSVPLTMRVPFEADPERLGALRLTGLTPVVESPRDVLEATVQLRVQVLSDDGRSGHATLEGLVRWGPDAC